VRRVATFVLVPGAWHGGWCWRRVAPHLRGAGHNVFTPTLTGLGERSHLLTPDVGFDTHVQDILQVLRFEEIENAVLVGHSYGALVVSQVAERVPERVSHIAAIDAGIPGDGQRGFDLLGPERAAALTQRAVDSGDGWRIPPPPVEALGIVEPADQAWVERLLTPHPLRSYQQPLQLRSSRAAAIGRTLIACNPNRTAPPGVQLVRLATGHDAMITEPEGLADLLLACAQSS
jgi:pimeloyl-ACP methyl ester carboxylesterase